MITRIEKDEFGEMEIPAGAYYGISSLRNKEYFTVTKFKIHKQMIKSLAIVKKACALSCYDALYLDLTKTRAIANACDEVINGRFNNQFITEAIQGGSCIAFNTNMNEVIANRANEMLGGKLGEYKYISLDDVNLFQSANDVVPTAVKHSLIMLSKPLLVELKKLQKCFQDLAKKYGKVLKLGRNHLQDSLPISYNQLFGAMTSTVSRDIKRLNEALEDLYVINLGTGSIGVPYYADDKYVNNILKRFNEFTEMEFKFPNNTLDETRNLDEFVNLSHSLKLMAVNLSKTATDIRLMASGPKAGFNEITLPSYERGSGISSSQCSQSIPEIVNQVCFQIIGKDTTVTLAAEHGELEVNAFASIVYPNLFDCLEYLTRALKLLREYSLEGMKINEEHSTKMLEESDGIIVSLLDVLDYKKCTEIVRRASQEQKSIKEICLEEKLFTAEELDKLLTVDYLRNKLK